jgi:uncharacterized phage protein (predicted DNA packaging)
MITAIKDRLDLSVNEFKTYLKVDHDIEDEQLEEILAAAMLQADHFCQNTFTSTDEAGAEVLDDIPADVKQAVMRIAAALYESRADHIAGENVAGLSYSTGQIEWNAQRLLSPYRRFFTV